MCMSWILGAGSDVCPFSYHCRGHDWQKPSIDLSRRRHQHKSHQRWVWMEEEGSDGVDGGGGQCDGVDGGGQCEGVVRGGVW